MAEFTLDDFRKEIERMRKLGNKRQRLAQMACMWHMISHGYDLDPGVCRLQGMIDAMTKQERRNPNVIDSSRRRRIAAGSASEPHEIEQFLTEFGHMQAFMRRMAQMSVWQRLKMIVGLGRPS